MSSGLTTDSFCNAFPERIQVIHEIGTIVRKHGIRGRSAAHRSLTTGKTIALADSGVR